MFDGKTGKLAGTYVHTEADGSSISYPKGLACDDRGYLYVGLASRSNKAFATLDVVKYDEKGQRRLAQVRIQPDIHHHR